MDGTWDAFTVRLALWVADGIIDGSRLGNRLGVEDSEIQLGTNNLALNTQLITSSSGIFIKDWGNDITLTIN